MFGTSDSFPFRSNPVAFTARAFIFSHLLPPISVSAGRGGGVSYFLFLALLADFAGTGAGFTFGGLPLPGTLRIASKTSGEYNASCDIGLKPPPNIRISTVRRGRFNAFAISLIVIPFIPQLSVNLPHFLNIVNISLQLLSKCEVKITNIFKNVEKKSHYLLT
jgi:hypothetical protein